MYQAQFGQSPVEHSNWIYYISSNTPYRAHSVYNTYYEGYYSATGDPRTKWGRSATVPNSEFTSVPWLFQQKYTSLTSPMRLSLSLIHI